MTSQFSLAINSIYFTLYHVLGPDKNDQKLKLSINENMQSF